MNHLIVRLMAANIESVRWSRELRRLIKAERPDVVVVEQAYRARIFLRTIRGYTAFHDVGVEASDTAILVRNDIEVLVRYRLTMTRRWIGGKIGKIHEPRVYPALRLRKAGIKFRVLGVHLETHNNPQAQADSLEAIVEWLTRTELPSIALGDFNRRAIELRQTAKEADAELSSGGKVDHALAARVFLILRRSLRSQMQEGAHGWTLYTVRIEGE